MKDWKRSHNYTICFTLIFVGVLFISGCDFIKANITGRFKPQENADNSCILHANEEFDATIYANGAMLIESDPIYKEDTE